MSDSTTLIISTFVDLFVIVFNTLLIVRILMSYIVQESNGFYATLISLTEPVLQPVRRLLPHTHGIDFAPLATFFLLQGVQILTHRLLGA